MKITLHRYYNAQASLELDTNDIAAIQEFSAADDAAWGPEHGDGIPYTKVTLNKDARTSEGMSVAYVGETKDEIEAMMALEPA